jgi:hypothetical protein
LTSSLVHLKAMRIEEIYAQFCLPKTLQEHMIRVGAVAQMMIDHRQ